MSSDSLSKPVNLGRHSAGCKICSHPDREEIERDFVNWRSPAVIAKEHGLKDRTSVYRHAHALGLVRKTPTQRAGSVRKDH
jgi:hypothetical protein